MTTKKSREWKPAPAELINAFEEPVTQVPDITQRFGTTAVKLDTYLSPESTLTIFTTPFFEPSRIPRPATGPPIMEKAPERTLANSAFGLKLDKVGGGFD